MEFYFSKLNFQSSLFAKIDISQKDQLLLGLTKTNNLETYRNTHFSFIECEEVIIKNSVFIYGKLVKFADKEESIINTSINKTESVIVPDKIIAKSYFIIDLRENYLIYSDVKNHINNKSFLERFNILINKGISELNSSIVANPISEMYAFYERLNRLKSILEIDLKIVPTNPNPFDIIEQVDSILKKQNLKEKHIVYKAKQGGINLDDEIITNTLYTDTGYGTGKAIGIDSNNNQVKIYTHKSEKQKRITLPDIRDMGVKEIVESIESIVDKMNINE